MNSLSQTAVRQNPAMLQQKVNPAMLHQKPNPVMMQQKPNPAMQQQIKVNPAMQQKLTPTAQQPVTTEYSIRVPKDNKKKHHIMRFNRNLKIDFKEWKGKTVKMERENNMKNFKELDEEAPKFGAGSEFGREAREEARRKKFGIASRQYKSEDQPWILKVDGKKEKKFKGIREGGVSANASYYIFTHGSDGIIEAFPLKEWYNFQPVQRYKALSAEEAEEEFSKRNKSINYFNIMFKKRLRNEEEDGEDADLEGEKKGKKSKKGKKNKDFKISEMDDWVDDDDDDDDNSDSEKEDGSDDDNDKKKKKKGAVKKKKRASDSEAFEESDDGDEEGRECDYISDSSASDSDLESQKEMKSVAEEDALRKLLASGDEEEEEEQKKDEEDKNEEDEEEGKEKEEKDKDKTGKSKDKAKDKKKNGSDSSSEGESGTAQNKDDKKSPTSTQSSRSATPTVASSSTSESLKRPAPNTSEVSPVKKIRLENTYVFPNTSSSGESRTITEDAVRRYLMRKPMTARELCQKFKRKSGLSSDELVETMTKVLRNINPTSQKIKEKTYFSIKVDPKQHHSQNS